MQDTTDQMIMESCLHHESKTDPGQSLSDERKIHEYFQRARKICGKKTSMSTLCCWKALEKGKKMAGMKDISYIHFFCCESLGFTLDISSLCLNENGLDGSYGGSFSSSLVKHGTSVPLTRHRDKRRVRISVTPQPNCPYVPFAWGRAGGPKSNKSNQKGSKHKRTK